MSTELKDALDRASQVAQAEFETRNAVDVIAPAARRVTRHRVGVWAGAGLASLAVVGGVVWGVDAVSGAQASPADPTTPWTGATGLAVDPNPDVAVPSNAWSTLDLAVRAKPRQIGKLSIDATAGLICNHTEPTDDPRIAILADDSTTSHRTTLEDCRAVWFVDGPSSTLSSWSVSASKPDHSFTYRFSIHNDSSQPIAIDVDSVYLWVETDPDTPSDNAAMYSSMMVGGSMWDSSGSVTVPLTSDEEPATIEAGGDYRSSITATTGGADGDLLGTLLANGQPYRVSIWARVHEDAPSGDASYLIQLGTNNDASWSLSGEGNVP